MVNVNDILFRASSVGRIMGEGKNMITDKQLEKIDELLAKRSRTDNQEKELQRLIEKRDNPDPLSETCKSYLRELFISVSKQREKIIVSKYLEHGTREEQVAITLLSLHKNIFLKKNKERLFNKYLSGEPDCYVGSTIKTAEEGYDTKICWSVFTMPDKRFDPLETNYFYQDHSYMALTGAKKWTTVYTLVNANSSLIMREKERVFYQLGCPEETDPEYIRRKIEIEKNMIFDIEAFKDDNPYYDFDCKDWQYDIPMSERIVEYTVERDTKVIEAMYEQIDQCRHWIKNNLL